ncbi:UTP--glucose-1-phosphate uridylyltransferase GalU [Rhodoligotrophos defluvii]|uniref:UTP--glucose-1-phosphate uridylyltransferase GalU n=1 Tax=Rhodoligotrophos defluvii TaxID=2561934 RepID=UPI0010C96104|nr:UTP--glucose-1-phosphate uridylyltransferase GalU [Rhodoligotrophos defluvii]
MSRRLRKAVFPVAGLGTRFLPATKAVPKEMLTIVDRPVIQLAVDEAREAGIEHFVFVTGRNKGVIEDHFDKQFELETTLKNRGKTKELDLLASDLPSAGQTSFTRQQEPLGLGHAVWCARELIGDEPFALLLPDMLIHASPGCLAQMIEIYNSHGGNVLAVEEVPHEDVHRYGVVDVEAPGPDGAQKVKGMVEKPRREDAPSNLIISGRYILQPEIFRKLEIQKPGSGGEIQLTDAMLALMQDQVFHALKFKGKTYDCGDKVGFLAANVAYGLARKDLGPAFRKALQEVLAANGEDVDINI